MTATGYALSGPSLYGRLYSLAVQTSPDTTALYGTESSGQSPLRVSFEVERKGSASATAKIAIYNLAIKNRAAIRRGVAVRLRAGYVGLIGNLFIGTVAKVSVDRQGPDIVTSMELVDAEPFVSMSTIDKPYGPGTHLSTILQDVAAAMRVTYFGKVVQVQNGVALGIPNFTYSNGFVASGSCKDVLNKLCVPRGLLWSVQNGALNIVPKTNYNGRPLFLLNRDTGLINVPADNGKSVTMQSLLNPALTPNSLVQLASKNISLAGVYKLARCKWTGDSHDNAWTVEMEGRRFTGPITPLKPAAGQAYAGAVI